MTAEAERTRTLHYRDPLPQVARAFQRTGLEQLQAVIDGVVPPPPIAAHVGMGFVSVAEGDVVLTGIPDDSHYNPIGSVHAGFAATLLDSACGCAVHSTLPAGVGYTTLEIKISLLRSISAETGPVTAHGWVTKPGRRAAFAEADLRDARGRVLATASSSCLIVAP
ncbi:PaaI family thioesterase [Occultella kanbiaonis]|uniref:PaaI family thioesterase n=1 Tax=Occultella kanbiaonis TaxID=2675754 RepID=UPI0012B6DA42|nr:PaaI family thioesterase [Occultella kanbiaonis]